VCSSDLVVPVVPAKPIIYNLSGVVVGLPTNQKLVLQNNGGSDLMVQGGKDVPFVIPVGLATGAKYSVTIAKISKGYCAVVNGEGMVMSSDVADIKVLCAATKKKLRAMQQPDNIPVRKADSRTPSPARAVSRRTKAIVQPGGASELSVQQQVSPVTPAPSAVEAKSTEASAALTPLAVEAKPAEAPAAVVTAAPAADAKPVEPVKPQPSEAEKKRAQELEKQFQPLHQRQFFERMR
jgi:hypothetical protein